MVSNVVLQQNSSILEARSHLLLLVLLAIVSFELQRPARLESVRRGR